VRGQKNEFHALEKYYNYFPQSTIKEIDIPAAVKPRPGSKNHYELKAIKSTFESRGYKNCQKQQ
jgi:hypothetical protein